MKLSKLVFFPKSSDNVFETSALIETLINSQFVATEADQNNQYLPGERFLNLIIFLGCSPNINLQPTEGEKHCFISFIEPTEQAACLGHTGTVNPKCPVCTKRIANWKTPDWQLPGELCTCDKCQQQTAFADLNWKQECGFARCGFEINHIYPHEAIPTEQMLDLLEKNTGKKWQYCYTNTSST